MKKKIFAFLLALVLPLAGCAALTGSDQPAGYRQVSGQEAMDMMAGQEDYLILDVRTQAEYDGGHIPGAICLPNEDIGREDPPQLPLKDQLILVYCRSGFGGEREFSDFIRRAQAATPYDTGVTPGSADRLLLLSTCAYDYRNARFVVLSRLEPVA